MAEAMLKKVTGYPDLIVLMLLLSLLSGTCLAEQKIHVVVSSKASFDSLSQAQVSDYFLGEQSESDEIKTAFDRNDFVLKGRFYRQVAGMSLSRLRAFWSKKVFTRTGRPPRIIEPDMIDDTSVFGDSFITYVYEDELTDALKVVYTLEDEEP